MAGGSVRAVAVLALALLLGAPRGARATISCSDVYQALTPCLTYLGGGSAVDPSCCSGIRNLVVAARTTADRQAACVCLRTAASAAPGRYITRAAALPGKCGVSIPYKISPSTDCSKIK